MNFLGIGPGEFFFVILFALIVLGPERLPGFARSLGKSIIRLRNWMNASPDAKVLLQIQQELQSEINDIRSTLREVTNSVRTDLNDTSNNIALTTSSLNTAITGAVQTSSATMNRALNDANSSSPESQRTIAKPATDEPAHALIDPATATPTDATLAVDAVLPPEKPAPPAEVVARSSKPNWLSPNPSTTPSNDTSAATHSDSQTHTEPVTQAASSDNPLHAQIRGLRAEIALLKGDTAPQEASTSLDNLPDSALYAQIRSLKAEIAQHKADTPTQPSIPDSAFHDEIRSLRAEINRLKITNGTAVQTDTVSMLQVTVEQLTRDLKEIRSEVAVAPKPAVDSDTIMFLRIELGQLTNRIDDLQREIRKANVEPNP